MKTHRTDVVSLVFGLLFVTVALLFTAQSLFSVEVPDVRWFLAGGGVLIGLTILVTALVPNRGSHKNDVTRAQPEGDEQASRPMLTE
jgi:hypothetical protein